MTAQGKPFSPETLADRWGCSAANVQRRVASLRTMSPLRLTILATLSKDGMKTETAYHARFSRHHQHGEWFLPAPGILAEITRIKLEYPQ